MKINIPNTKRNYFKNVPHTTPDDKKRLFCPLCIYQGKEIFVYLDQKSKLWTCPECGYVIPKHLDPIERSKITAGNEQEVETPYAKSVSYHQVLKNRPKPDTYNNPMDAWNDL
jgi:hypothetical protein